MNNLGFGLVLFVAVAHAWFMVLESVLWTRPFGRKTFGQSREDAEKTKVLALNQGLYNGGVAALLVWAALEERGLTAGAGRTVDALLIFIVAMGVADPADPRIQTAYDLVMRRASVRIGGG